jgi:hypothetical protein
MPKRERENGPRLTPVGTAVADLLDDVWRQAGLERLRGRWFGVDSAVEERVNRVMSGYLDTAPGNEITIYRGTGVLLFFFPICFILLTIGFFIIFISMEILIAGTIEGLYFLGLGICELAISLALLWSNASLLRPAELKIDEDCIEFVVDGVVSKRITWSRNVEIVPWANHAFGYNSFYGFVVREGKTRMSFSPDEGWPLRDLRRAVRVALTHALETDVKISKYFLRVKGY